MSDKPTRQQRRKAAREAEKARMASLRRKAIASFAMLAETDETICGATLILPDGTIERIDASHIRRGGGNA